MVGFLKLSDQHPTSSADEAYWQLKPSPLWWTYSWLYYEEKIHPPMILVESSSSVSFSLRTHLSDFRIGGPSFDNFCDIVRGSDKHACFPQQPTKSVEVLKYVCQTLFFFILHFTWAVLPCPHQHTFITAANTRSRLYTLESQHLNSFHFLNGFVRTRDRQGKSANRKSMAWTVSATSFCLPVGERNHLRGDQSTSCLEGQPRLNMRTLGSPGGGQGLLHSHGQIKYSI